MRTHNVDGKGSISPILSTFILKSHILLYFFVERRFFNLVETLLDKKTYLLLSLKKTP
jgi:hypothetical protein